MSHRRLLRSTLLLGILLLSPASLLANERWFEIEMIIFERTGDLQLKEQFPAQVNPIRLGRHLDLVTPELQPDISSLLRGLPACLPPPLQSSVASRVSFNSSQPVQNSLCLTETQPLAWQSSHLFPEYQWYSELPWPTALPSQLSRIGEHQPQPYLAPASALQLTEIVNRLRRQRQHDVLLHTVWRQAPVTERRAIPSRWFAGRNFSDQFDYWGQPRAADEAELVMVQQQQDQQDWFEQIDSNFQQVSAGVSLAARATTHSDSPASLQSNANLPAQVWQLDGLLRLHLDHYLFINADFNLRRNHNQALQTIYVQQSRRLISGEIHYLDHPKLGIIIQIRRFDPATASTDATISE